MFEKFWACVALVGFFEIVVYCGPHQFLLSAAFGDPRFDAELGLILQIETVLLLELLVLRSVSLGFL